tara:strand:- start:891 stop:1373 length:483 start_codon:yes stop_codon:yes gene_type:complete
MANNVSTSPFFISQKEYDLFNHFNEELVDDVVGQAVDIYKVDLNNTDSNIYGESDTKYYNVGFRVNCLVQYNRPETITNDAGADLNANIQLRFQRANLASGSLDFYPEVGDLCDWNNYYWELNSIVEPQLVAGNPNFNHSIVAEANRARISSLQIVERPR